MTEPIEAVPLAPARLEPTVAEIVQTKITSHLACPYSGGPVEVVPLETAGRAIRRGIVWSRSLDRMVGRIENFQFDFVRFQPPSVSVSEFHAIKARTEARELPSYTDSVFVWRLEPRTSSAIKYIGSCIPLDGDDVTAIEHSGSAIVFESAGEIELLLFAHPWSGVVEIRYLDRVDLIDLYGPQAAYPHPYRLDLGPVRERVEIRLTERKNDASLGMQCLFGGYRVKTDARMPLRHERNDKVRGAPFTDSFQKLLALTPQDGLLLDIGGGNRQFDDARYVNLDYADYSEPDVIGDATNLPFGDGAIDSIYSTGVFEHISDPAKAGAEVVRILKSGGRAVIGWAFMQPIHSEGRHFYNATPWGVEHAFPGLKVNRMWYDTSISFLVEWGASVSNLKGRVPDEEVRSVCEILRRWDALIPEENKQYMANGVWCEFEKP